MSTNSIAILEGSTFVVCDLRGDIEGAPNETRGLFADDTRFLSRWVMTVNGARPSTLSTDDVEYFESQFFLTPSSGTIYVDSDISIFRRRTVEHGFAEELTIINHASKPATFDVRIEADADFADLFEVKDVLQKKGERFRKVEDGHLVLGYKRDTFVRQTDISATDGATLDEGGLRFHVELAPHSRWTTSIAVRAQLLGDQLAGTRKTASRGGAKHVTTKQVLATVPRVSADWMPLVLTYRRSVVDLAALQFYAIIAPEASLPAAGLPWFMAIFGRDSVLTSFQALPFAPDLAKTTLRVLGARQGTHIDPFRDEEPGKILHESRNGEMTAFKERPHSPYFGSADATPLWLILLDEYERWTGDAALVKSLELEARAALRWIDEYGDRMGNGYISYQRRNEETGLENQCWKDSWNSILFRDGTNSILPRACCEIQGYAYDAKMRAARLARTIWGDPGLATRLESQAAALKERFNRDFWMPDRKCFALAIDGSGRKVDSITSNIGHLLWSGIVDDDKVQPVVDHLMSDALFTGWGIRTMADTEAGYNPIGYHVGTVWPHDNSFIALGLNRYGYREESSRIAAGILEAADYFKHRLPEAFAGYPRELTKFPVEYPTACSPQAWATGAPLLLLRTMLGLEPRGNRLIVDAALPPIVTSLDIEGICGRWGAVDVAGRRAKAKS